MKFFKHDQLSTFQKRFDYTIKEQQLKCTNKIVLYACMHYLQIEDTTLQHSKRILESNILKVQRHHRKLLLSFLNRVKMEEIKIEEEFQIQLFQKYIGNKDLKAVIRIGAKSNVKWISVFFDHSDYLLQKIRHFTIKSFRMHNFYEQRIEIISHGIYRPEEAYTCLKQKNPEDQYQILSIFGYRNLIQDYIVAFAKAFEQVKVKKFIKGSLSVEDFVWNRANCLQEGDQLTKVVYGEAANYAIYRERPKDIGIDIKNEAYDNDELHMGEPGLQELLTENPAFRNYFESSPDLFHIKGIKVISKKKEIDKIKLMIQKNQQSKQTEANKSFIIGKQMSSGPEKCKILSVGKLRVELKNYQRLFDKFVTYSKSQEGQLYSIRLNHMLNLKNAISNYKKVFILFKDPLEIIQLQTVLLRYNYTLHRFQKVIEYFLNNPSNNQHQLKDGNVSQLVFVRRKQTGDWQRIVNLINSEHNLMKVLILGKEYFSQLLQNSSKLKSCLTVAFTDGFLADIPSFNFQYDSQIQSVVIQQSWNSTSLGLKNILKQAQQLLSKDIRSLKLKQQSVSFPIKQYSNGYLIDPITCYNIQTVRRKGYFRAQVPFSYFKKQDQRQLVCLTFYPSLFEVTRDYEKLNVTGLREIQRQIRRELSRVEYSVYEAMRRQAVFYGHQFFLIYGGNTMDGKQCIQNIQQSLEQVTQTELYTLKYWQNRFRSEQQAYQLKTIKFPQSQQEKFSRQILELLQSDYGQRCQPIVLCDPKIINKLAQMKIGYGSLKVSRIEASKNVQFIADLNIARKMVNEFLNQYLDKK